MAVIQKHSKSYYGRPKSQVTSLLDKTVRGVARTQKRRDTHLDRYLVAIAKLSEEDRRAITRYMEHTLALEGLTTFKLALEWLLGSGLDQRTFTKNFTTLWGEEEFYPYE